MSPRDTRKLLAILYADVEGYSRMMGENASSTVKSLTRTRDLFAKNVAAGHGRVVNAPGDSILVEFASVVDAVSCAMRIQDQLISDNSRLPRLEQMNYRIGINLGDVIQKEKELFGDGVNIAARVESLTPVGGVCITRPVYDQVKNILSEFDYKYTGRHRVKNIKEPVFIYEVRKQHDLNQVLDPETSDKFISVPHPDTNNELSQGATIAVLPFENFSGEQTKDYFSRGFVEDLITDIAHFKPLELISSYTSRKIGVKNRDKLLTARELGIDYLLTGGLTRRKKMIRITAQLVDTQSGRLLWAERYDAPGDDVFDIQDDIAQQVAGSISIQIDRELLAKARNKPSTSLAVYDYWLQGMELLRSGSRKADQNARKIFEKALAIDPYYSRAYTGISLSYFNDWSCQVTDQWDTIGTNAYKYAMKAVSLDSNDHVAQLVIGRILMYKQEFELAEQHLDKSIALNPNDADSLIKQASSKAFLGNPEQGEQLFLKALKLNPYRNLWYFTHGSLTYFVQKKFKQCIETALKGPLTEEWIDLPAFIAASFAHLDDPDNARRYLKIFISAFQERIAKGKPPGPDDIINWCRIANPFQCKEHSDLYISGLIKAGLQARGTETPPEEKYTSSNIFRGEDKLWLMRFKNKTIRLPGVKGFGDISTLLGRPGQEVHCSELMGITGSFTPEDPMLDEKAKQTYKQRIKELKADIKISDENNDIVRSHDMRSELEEIKDHLAKSLGFFNHSRKLNSDTERVRSAVTWRIRSAVKKIKAVHPALGQHLTNTISTGTFCSYQPEKDLYWKL